MTAYPTVDRDDTLKVLLAAELWLLDPAHQVPGDDLWTDVAGAATLVRGCVHRTSPHGALAYVSAPLDGGWWAAPIAARALWEDAAGQPVDRFARAAGYPAVLAALERAIAKAQAGEPVQEAQVMHGLVARVGDRVRHWCDRSTGAATSTIMGFRQDTDQDGQPRSFSCSGYSASVVIASSWLVGQARPVFGARGRPQACTRACRGRE